MEQTKLIELTDDELEAVAGGAFGTPGPYEPAQRADAPTTVGVAPSHGVNPIVVDYRAITAPGNTPFQ